MAGEYRHVLKVHEDALTVPKVMNSFYNEFKELGYSMLSKYPGSFSYKLGDNSIILVFWEDGKIYEDVAIFPDQQINPDFQDYVSEL